MQNPRHDPWGGAWQGLCGDAGRENDYSAVSTNNLDEKSLALPSGSLSPISPYEPSELTMPMRISSAPVNAAPSMEDAPVQETDRKSVV